MNLSEGKIKILDKQNAVNIEMVKKVLLFVVFAMAAVLFCLFFSHSTSPIFSVKMGDSDTFALIGRGILDGKIPYTDMHENKGPLLFLLEAFPQLIYRSHTSIFVFQCALMFVNFYLIYLLTKKYFRLGIARTYITEAVFCISMMLTYVGGNMAEEYDVFFTVVGSYFFFHAIFNDNKKKFGGIVLGICTMAVLMIKMPDAAGLLALDLMYLIYALYDNQSNEKTRIFLKRFLILAVSAIVTLGLIIFYYAVHHAILDMMYHYLYINFKMTNVDFKLSRIEMLFSHYGLVAVLPVFASVVSFIASRKKERKEKFLAISITVFSFCSALATFTHTTGYIQHVMPVAASYILAFGNLLKCIPQKVRGFSIIKIAGINVVLICGIPYLTRYFSANNYVNPIRNDFSMEARGDNLFMEDIPKNERDSVYRFGETENGWYYYNDFYPYYKWLNLRTLIAIGLNEVAEEFEYKMMNDPVKYLVYSKDIHDYEDFFSEELIEYIENSYTLVKSEYKESYGCDVGLYRLNR